MMSVSLIPFLIFNLAKDSFFFSSSFFLDKSVMFLLFIFPLVIFLILNCLFVGCGVSDMIFYSFSYISLVFLLALCFCSSLPFLFLFFLECCVFIMILLIFNFSKDKDKFSSASFMFITNIVGSIPFMYFCSLFWSSSFKQEVGSSSVGSLFLLFSCYLILVSKVPVFFVHFWLTKAHVSAGGSSSMILASLMLKIGTLGLLNFCFLFLSDCSNFLFSLGASFSVLGCFFVGLVMIRFFDVKYMVACSSIVHMAIIFPSCLLPLGSSFLASFLMMVGHGLISCVIFFLVTVIYECTLNRSSDSGKGAESVSSFLVLFLFFFFLLNLGFPPFVSFLSEFIFISFFLGASLWCLSIFLLSLMLVGLVFMFTSLIFLFSKGLKKWEGFLDYISLVSFLAFSVSIGALPIFFC